MSEMNASDMASRIESMNLLTDRMDASSLEGEMKDAAEGLNAALDRIAAIVDEHKESSRIQSDS